MNKKQNLRIKTNKNYQEIGLWLQENQLKTRNKLIKLNFI